MTQQRTVVVILAAGKGTRMAHELPKVLVPVRGTPMILHVLAAVERAKFQTKPVLVIGDRGEQIKKVVGDRAQFVWQKHLLGTGHAVRVTEKLLRGKASDIVVVYGDSPLVRPETLRRLVALRRSRRAAMSLVTVVTPDYRGPRRVFARYGRILRDTSGKNLVRCVEYKDATKKERSVREVNSGFYCFEAKWLWKNLPKLKKKNVSGEYYLTDLMGLAVSQGKRVAPFALKDWREGVGANTQGDIKTVENITTQTRPRKK